MPKQKHKRGNATQKERMLAVLDRFTDLVKDEEEDIVLIWSDYMEEMLSEIASNDGFGTEGQSDPRGDFRNGEWSMRRVEGLDK